jgi:hypothetical protein
VFRAHRRSFDAGASLSKPVNRRRVSIIPRRRQSLSKTFGAFCHAGKEDL